MTHRRRRTTCRRPAGTARSTRQVAACWPAPPRKLQAWISRVTRLGAIGMQATGGRAPGWDGSPHLRCSHALLAPGAQRACNVLASRLRQLRVAWLRRLVEMRAEAGWATGPASGCVPRACRTHAAERARAPLGKARRQRRQRRWRRWRRRCGERAERERVLGTELRPGHRQHLLQAHQRRSLPATLPRQNSQHARARRARRARRAHRGCAVAKAPAGCGGEHSVSLAREESRGDQAQARHAVPRYAAAVEHAARLPQKVPASRTRTASVC